MCAKISSEAFEKLLQEEYLKFELDFFGKKIWTPYRINVPFQEDRRRYGKWSAVKIKSDTLEIVREVGFDIERASADEIRNFMRAQKLGIDCSGFVYQILSGSLRRIGVGTMQQIGFPKASSTNVLMLTSDKFSSRVEDIAGNVQAGDMIRFGPNADGQWHIVIVLASDGAVIRYADSSGYNEPDGVGVGRIEVDNPNKRLSELSWYDQMSNGRSRGQLYDPKHGDGVYRLNVLK